MNEDFDVSERRTRRTEFLIALAVLVVFVGAIAFRIRGHRNLTRLKSELHSQSAPVSTPQPLRPGGQDPITLSRSAMANNEMPEFVSATLLPGRGMSIFQITASVPGEGEVPLLDSPALEDAAKSMTETGTDANGEASMDRGAPFLLPWSGRIYGTRQGDNVVADWNGHSLLVPARSDVASAPAIDGLLLDKDAGSLHHDAVPDGGLQEGTFDLGDFDGHWPSHTEATVSVLLSGRTMTLTLTAKNTGSSPEPLGIGWMPHLLLRADRNLVRLHLPEGPRVEERPNGQPTGKLLPVTGTVEDFTQSNGAALGRRSIDATFVHLHTGPMDSGPVFELIQPSYGLRLTALTTAIRSFRIVAPADKKYIVIEPDFDYPDPFGHEWAHDEDTGMTVLQPGQTVQWKIRMEIFSPVARGSRFDATP